MAEIPRSLRSQSAIGVNRGLSSTTPQDFGASTSRALQGAGNDLFKAGQNILRSEGESLAIDKFSEFQKDEILRLNQEKQQNIETPDGFTTRFLEQSKKNFKAISSQSTNKFFTDTINSRFIGLTNSITNSATAFEASQNTANRKSRYASATGSYIATVSEDPSLLPMVLNQIKGDDLSAVGNLTFGSSGQSLSEARIKSVVNASVYAQIQKDPFNARAFIKESGIDKILSSKDLISINKTINIAQKNFSENAKFDRFSNQLSQHSQVANNFFNGTLTQAEINAMVSSIPSSATPEEKRFTVEFADTLSKKIFLTPEEQFQQSVDAGVRSKRVSIAVDEIVPTTSKGSAKTTFSEKQIVTSSMINKYNSFFKNTGDDKIGDETGFSRNKNVTEIISFVNDAVSQSGKTIPQTTVKYMVNTLVPLMFERIKKDKTGTKEGGFLGFGSKKEQDPHAEIFKSVLAFIEKNSEVSNESQKLAIINIAIQKADQAKLSEKTDPAEKSLLIDQIAKESTIEYAKSINPELRRFQGDLPENVIRNGIKEAVAVGKGDVKTDQSVTSGFVDTVIPNDAKFGKFAGKIRRVFPDGTIEIVNP